MITHIDLFSGIGGFALAIDNVFGKENVKHIFCDNDKFCQAIIRKHWKDSEICGDIRTFAYTEPKRLEGRMWNNKGNQRKESKSFKQDGNKIRSEARCLHRIDILTGGFPCQPFSQAGVRKGTSDDRYLWPEMLRVIRETKPRWVIAENVRGILTIQDGMVFEQVCADLEGEDYEVRAFVIPAVAIGAPHRRDRVWFVGNAKGTNTPDTRQQYGQQGNSQELETNTTKRTTRTTDDERQGKADWSRDWKEVAFATCNDGMDDGLSRQMDRTTISSSKHRTERLKACGNAIVPQVVEQILRGIKAIE